MSNVSAKTEHLVRAAVKGILGNPQTWSQGNWVKTPEDYGRSDEPVPACGTTYCIGGWMLLYDGWTHHRTRGHPHTWTRGDTTIGEPFSGYLASLFEKYEGGLSVANTIFDGYISSIEDLLKKIDDDLEINFEEDCPCLTEEGSCILAGCPCGTHVFTTMLPEVKLLEGEDSPLMKVIAAFAHEAQAAGDRITVRHILADQIMLDAFVGAYTAGQQSLVETVTKKAERRIQEARMGFDASDGQYQSLKVENEALRKQVDVLSMRNSDQVIRKLQGQIDDLKSGVRQDPAFAKLQAKQKKAEDHLRVASNVQAALNKRVAQLRDELMYQKRSMQQAQQLGRDEGFKKAVQSWQKALDVVKKEENL